eukprot:CAMPEP_0117064156 /NCGR_PEP_ID=MMETSP0472-20121206/44798_1 /TAXON_ID=693140 ORGANISM="Tiarina fusus, Strain LIS" /NCGR_SAMPLE_ID=MMETSP0472 /ASSEMBLY_ACC=CAM_ASM_000603 /LENGTH=488 /DNA_ID=CAMNT_0004784167 /DNA_START=43 /DNA_END=1509 /DNA_ORIENTATION=+
MTIPIVQGTAVPEGNFSQSSYGTEGGYKYSDGTNNNDTTTPYTATTNDGVYAKPEEQPKQFRDVAWALLFLVHLAAMVCIITLNLISGENGGGNGGADVMGTYGGVIWLVAISAVSSAGIGTLALGVMMRNAVAVVKISLIFSVLMSLLVAILGFLSGQTFMGVLGLAMFAIGVCYAKAVWSRIPFAAANLNTALTAVKANMGLTFVAYLMLLLAFGWSALWFVGLGEALSSSNGAVLFFLFLSYYWVHQVLSNTVTVTTAGTVGTWWFVPEEASSCFSSGVQDSFCRATTYSFGSICLGSLIVAVVQALRALAHMSRDSEDMQLLVCIIDCILACIQDIIEYLNKWAYVYVGLYGFGYMEAGKSVFQLFQQKGWTVIISDDLCDRVLFMVSLAVGFLSGLISLALAAADPNLLAALQLEGGVGTAGFIIGFLVGLVICSILMSVVGAAVNTVIVCYAESPAEFEANHPRLSSEMRSAWTQAWPEIVN